MAERAGVRRENPVRDRITQDLEVVLREVAVLPERAEEWDPENANDEQDAYEPEWASVVYDRFGDLERAHRAGKMGPVQEKRYARAKALLREQMPLIERYGLEKPSVPLGD